MHAHHHHHSHGGRGHGEHDHGQHSAGAGGRYGLAIALNLGFAVCEALAGLAANSTALLADAGHNLSDVLGLAMSGGAAWLATRAPSERRTYGFAKASVLSALANALILVSASGAIAWEAIRRLFAPEPTQPTVIMIVAAAGLLINGGSALLFVRNARDDVNVRSAFVHMAADAGVSAGVIVSGLIMVLTRATWIDPIAGLVVCAVILWSTWSLMRELLDLTLDAAPRGIDVPAVRAHLAALPGVAAVHDLHVWAMSASEPALTAHLVLPDGGGDDGFLADAARSLSDRFAIRHATLQVERAHADACAEHGHP